VEYEGGSQHCPSPPVAGHIDALVVGEGLRLAGVGAVVGLAGAMAATRVMHSLLFNAHPLDPSALASYLPARGATGLDPIAALRAQ
jgi:hypothetical protein